MKSILLLAPRTGAYTSFTNHPALQEYTFTLDHLEDIAQEGVSQYIAWRTQGIETGALKVDGVLGTSELTCGLANVLAVRTGLPAPQPQAMLACQNKYISRRKQAECVPEHVPRFALASQLLAGDAGLGFFRRCLEFIWNGTQSIRAVTYPLFVKPVRGSLSAFAQVVESKAQLQAHIATQRAQVMQDTKLYGAVLALGHFNDVHVDTYRDFLCEQVLEGVQVCVDGYVFAGKVVLFGTTRAHLLPGTLSFSRWDYPASFGETLDKKIEDLVRTLVVGIGLDSTSFNVELKVNEATGKIFIIELHARPSVQFAALTEQVTGYNPLRAACDVALGIDPGFEKPASAGVYNVCCSCVLRRTDDAQVVQVPSVDEIARLERRYPGVEIILLVEVSKKLSDYRQDCDTYRYGLITIPGRDIADVEQKRVAITQDLTFVFAA